MVLMMSSMTDSPVKKNNSHDWIVKSDLKKTKGILKSIN